MLYSFISRPKRGEVTNGDAVKVFGDGQTKLFAVVDALGHGPEAFKVSQMVLSAISEIWKESLQKIMTASHKRLAGSRGAALFLARFHGENSGTWECAGIGNIECKAISKSAAPFSLNGTAGLCMRKVHVFNLNYRENETYCFITDGIHNNVDLRSVSELDIDRAAQEIMARYGKDYDDATVLLIRT